MKEIVTSIIQAEELAEQIIVDANKKAKDFFEQGEEKIEAERKKTVALFNLEKKTAISKAQEQADGRYEEIIKEAEADSIKVKEQAKSKLDKIAQKIVDGICK